MQNATSQSFSLLAYCLPLIVGYLADTRFGRYPMIFWGVIICGVGHVLIVAGGAKTLIDNGTAKIPFFIGVYILAIGAGTLRPVYLNPSSSRHLANLLFSQPCSNPMSHRSCWTR